MSNVMPIYNHLAGNEQIPSRPGDVVACMNANQAILVNLPTGLNRKTKDVFRSDFLGTIFPVVATVMIENLPIQILGRSFILG